MQHKAYHCRRVSRMPQHAQTGLQVKTEAILNLVTMSEEFLGNMLIFSQDFVSNWALTFGTISSIFLEGWNFGYKRLPE